jgi:hypothetical protein
VSFDPVKTPVNSAHECYSRGVHTQNKQAGLKLTTVKNSQKNLWKTPVLGLVALLLLWGGVSLYQTVMEIGPEGTLSLLWPKSQHHVPTVRLEKQPVYQVKKRQELLGVQVSRVISKQQPEEFLILDGLSPNVVNGVFGKNIDRFWANQMANHLVKLRSAETEASSAGSSIGGSGNVKIEVQDVRTLKTGFIQQGKQQLPYWNIQIQFQLSNENQPRYYQASVVRYPKPNGKKDSNETVVVGYAAKGAFQQNLVADLLQHLEFTSKP